MSLEDLDVKIKLDVSDAPYALQQLGKVQTQIDTVAVQSGKAEVRVRAIGTGLATVRMAVAPLALVGAHMGVLAGSTGLAASGVSYLAAGFGLLHNLAVLLSAGIGFLLWPLRGLVIIPKLIAVSFGVMFAVILAPFKVLIGLVAMAYRGIRVLLIPVMALAKAWYTFKIGLHSIVIQFKLLGILLAALPPKIRMVVVGLVALGAAGRAGAAVMSILSRAIRLATVAVVAMRFAVLLVTKPFQAMQVAVAFTARSLAILTVRTINAGIALTRMAIAATVAGMKSLASAVYSVTTALGSKLYSAASSAATALGLVGAAIVAWGMKTAIGLETAETVFGVLLKDMAQGKALIAALNATKVAPLFDTKQIQDAGRDLIKAGVPVTQVTTKLEQLGQMAVATKTPIEELSRIYRQGMAKGAFQTDLVNQMAERGIDIYHALEAATGKSGAALAKMIQAGKIGATEMNAAIQHMTTGTGIYAGAVEAVSQTTAGMFSRITNNIQQALGAMFAGGNTTFGKMLQSVVTMTEGWKTSFVSLSPVVVQVFGVVSDAFMMVWNIGKSVFAAIFGAGQATFGGMIQVGMEWATKFRWFFQNFGDIARFAFLQLSLFGVTAFNDIIYFFTDSMPAYLNWFSENWRQVFMDAGNLIVTVFANIGRNIGNAMTQIWAFIKSGGTAELQFAFVPLLDGFKATVAELPNIPERAMTQLETDLTNQMQSLGTSLADNFDKMQADAMASLQTAAPAAVELKDAPGSGSSAHSDGISNASKKAVENKAALVRSSEGQSVVTQFLAGMNKGDTQKRTLKVTEAIAKDMHVVAREIERGKPMKARAWA